jgi:hypothetical protein
MRVRGKIGLTYHLGKQDEQGVFQMVPSRILLFYIHQFVDDNGEHSSEIRALVQTCDYQVGSDRNYTAMHTHVQRSVHLSALLIT